MQTSIVTSDQLMADALKATSISAQHEAVEMWSLKLLRLKQQIELRKLRGKYEWEGDLDAMTCDT